MQKNCEYNYNLKQMVVLWLGMIKSFHETSQFVFETTYFPFTSYLIIMIHFVLNLNKSLINIWN